MPDSNSSQSVVSSVSRRQVIASGAAAVASGLTYVAVGADAVTASVSADQLSVGDAQYAATDGTIYSPYLSVDAAYQFAGIEDAAAVMVALLIDGGLVDTETTAVAGGSDDGAAGLSAAVVDSRAWASSDWTAPDGGAVSHDISVEVRLEVRNADRDVLAKASASDTPTVTVEDAGPSQTATIGGSGSVSFVPEEGATPTE